MPFQKTSAANNRRANGAARKRRPRLYIWDPPFEPDNFTRAEMEVTIRKVVAALKKSGMLPALR